MAALIISPTSGPPGTVITVTVPNIAADLAVVDQVVFEDSSLNQFLVYFPVGGIDYINLNQAGSTFTMFDPS
jgi:hypothetical protein